MATPSVLQGVSVTKVLLPHRLVAGLISKFCLFKCTHSRIDSTKKTMEKRIKKKPQRFGEWEETVNFRNEPKNEEVNIKIIIVMNKLA